MAIKQAPPVTPTEIKLHPLSNTAINESPVNRSTETLELSGARIEGYLSWDKLNEDEEKQLQSWIASLRGAAGRFFVPHYRYLKPQGDVSGTPIVSADLQYGAKIGVKDLLPNQTAWIEGDWVSINDELKIVTADCLSNGLGFGELTFEPPLRQVVNQGEAIMYNRPHGIFRLKDDKQGSLALRRDKPGKIKVEIVEAF